MKPWLALLALAACAPSTRPAKLLVSAALAAERGAYAGHDFGFGGSGRILIPASDSARFGAAAEILRFGDRDARWIMGLLRFEVAEPGPGRLHLELGLGGASYSGGGTTEGFILAQVGLVYSLPVTDWLEWETSLHATFIPCHCADFGDSEPPSRSLGLSSGLGLLF